MDNTMTPAELNQGSIWAAKFEAAGLGKAPYKFLGARTVTYQACQGAPVQPGGSCDWCATGIYDQYRFRSSDGREFKLGCDCFHKAMAASLAANALGTDGAKLLAQVKTAERKLAREKAAAKRAATKATLADMLQDETVRTFLQNAEHPRGFSGLTALDWAQWFAANAGGTGQAKVVKAIRKMMGGV